MSDLAEGLASHIRRWAQAAGAPAESLSPLAEAAKLVCAAIESGQVCAHLDEMAERFPSQAELRAKLLASGMVAEAGSEKVLPLVLDAAGRLYLHRYFDYEQRLAASLLARCSSAETSIQSSPRRKPGSSSSVLLDSGFRRNDEFEAQGFYLPPNEGSLRLLDDLFARNAQRLGDAPDWQRLAVALALQSRLTIISGGPGTGKTTTVVALLACLLQENPELRVKLAAPTGKAAARMLEAVRQNAASLPPELRERLPSESSTLHRLLGATGEAGRFRHHRSNPLPLDALVVDEASMLDLSLAVHLLEALPPQARLILLGDKDQLAAVEAGAIFAEISADAGKSAECLQALSGWISTPVERLQAALPTTTGMATGLRDSVVWFSESHRFADTSGIGRLAAQIRAGQGTEACGWLAQQGDETVGWLQDGEAQLAPETRQAILAGFAPYLRALEGIKPGLEAASVEFLPEIFATFDQFRVLCALRETPRGVRAINALVEKQVRQRMAIGLPEMGGAWYAGRPVMVTCNDHAQKLYNGDIGICLPDERGVTMVYFPASAGGFRAILPVRLPEHESAFAMTVHKAQGSEFNEVFLLLPAEPNRVVTRELLYTGITRAAKQVTLVGSQQVLLSACANPTRRHSGLIDRMRGA
ncbi:MAG: exodeoxyribonuclease alpha subunit [Proteobacteria bacterium]|nr:exodeoxyribonuclease alpha subunit [Pseudomonadota bacterium]